MEGWFVIPEKYNVFFRETLCFEKYFYRKGKYSYCGFSGFANIIDRI